MIKNKSIGQKETILLSKTGPAGFLDLFSTCTTKSKLGPYLLGLLIRTNKPSVFSNFLLELDDALKTLVRIQLYIC